MTIVVPAYNEAAHIEGTLRTVLAAAEKHLDDFEIIVVDDGSRDDTGKIAEEIARTNPRIRVFRRPVNEGVGAAYLYGLEQARFPYLTLIPGDNVFQPAAFDNVFPLVDTAPLIVSYRGTEKRTPLRMVLSVICTILLRLITWRGVRDAHGMYVYPVDVARTIPVSPGYGYHLESLGRLLCILPRFVQAHAPLTDRPDANSGVMKWGVVARLGVTMLRLAMWRIGTLVLGLPDSRGARPVRQPLPRSSVGLIATAIAAFLFSIWFADALGLRVNEPTNRMRFHAIPVAISQLYHGHPHDYTGYWSVAMLFQSPDYSLNDAMGLALQPPGNMGPYYWTADDRGLADYVYWAFDLFGPSIASLFYFWFVMLGVTLAAALVRFRRDPQALALIVCAAIGICATLPAFTRAAALTFEQASIHISESRMFDVLGALAALHILLVMLRPQPKAGLLDGICLTVQVLFLAALVHMRTSLAWLFVAILLVGALLAALRWRSNGLRVSSRTVIVPMAVVLAGWLGIFVYQHKTFNQAYFAEIGPRTFWHNVLMGLSLDAAFAKQLNMAGVDDGVAVTTVLQNMKAHNDPRLTPAWNTTSILNSLGSHNTFDWRTYEAVTKELVLDTLRSAPLTALRLFFWNKPKLIGMTISCRYLGITRTCPGHTQPPPDAVVRTPHPVVPWVFAALIMLTAGLLVTARREAGAQQAALWPRILLPIAIFIVLGLAPSILIYPAVTQLGGTVVLLYTLAFFLGTTALASLVINRLEPALVGIGRPR